MAEFRMGPDGYAAFVHAGGTISLYAQVRNVKISKSINLLDRTAGSDGTMKRLAGIKDWNISIDGLHNDTESPMGTADTYALVPGLSGTIIIGMRGTVTGKPKFSGPCIIENFDDDFPYDDVAKWTFSVKADGDYTNGAF